MHKKIAGCTAQEASDNSPMAAAKNAVYDSNIFKVHSSKLKPPLTNANKLHRLLYCMNQVKPGSIVLHGPVFEDQMNRVHVDEKWFWLCKDGARSISWWMVSEPPRDLSDTRATLRK
jgi:hypothetical protein